MCLCLQLGEGMWGAQSTGGVWGVAWLEERSPDCLRWGPHQGNPSGTGQQAWAMGFRDGCMASLVWAPRLREQEVW